jgi:hypothetical protein
MSSDNDADRLAKLGRENRDLLTAMQVIAEKGDKLILELKTELKERVSNERNQIAKWLRKIDAVSRWGGPESAEIISVTEVMNAIADAIERGEHEVKSDGKKNEG